VKINTLVLGDFQTNCYVLSDPQSQAKKQCIIIDPGFGCEPLIRLLNKEAMDPRKILLTHGHCDHIAGIGLVRDNFGDVPVYISEADSQMLTDAALNLSLMMGCPVEFGPPDGLLADNDIVELGGIKLQVMNMPGHTPGGVAFYCRAEKLVFAGDSLFAGSVGRCDFPGGDMDILLNSIRTRLFPLPDETKVYSGHGPITSIGQEKHTNPYLR